MDVKALRTGPWDKNFSAAYQNIFLKPNGDVVAAVPPVHLTHRKVFGYSIGSLVERVDIMFFDGLHSECNRHGAPNTHEDSRRVI